MPNTLDFSGVWKHEDYIQQLSIAQRLLERWVPVLECVWPRGVSQVEVVIQPQVYSREIRWIVLHPKAEAIANSFCRVCVCV